MLWANDELASKLKFTVVPACAFMNWPPSVVNASFSDEAANTVIEPDSPAPEPLLLDEVPDDEQAVRPPSATAVTIRMADSRTEARVIRVRPLWSPTLRRPRWSISPMQQHARPA